MIELNTSHKGVVSAVYIPELAQGDQAAQGLSPLSPLGLDQEDQPAQGLSPLSLLSLSAKVTHDWPILYSGNPSRNLPKSSV